MARVSERAEEWKSICEKSGEKIKYLAGLVGSAGQTSLTQTSLAGGNAGGG